MLTLTQSVVGARPAAARPCPRCRCVARAAAAPASSPQQLRRRAALSAALLLPAALTAFPRLAVAEDAPPADVPFKDGPEGLRYADTVVGDGPEALKGDVIKVGYVGTLTDSGKKFDAARFFTFGVGNGEVIRGWDLGILGDGGAMPAMKVGGTRLLQIPAALAYGARGAGCKAGECIIPPGATLSFTVELKGYK